MALRDEVRRIASDLDDVTSRANETVLDNGLGALIAEVHAIAVRAGKLANNLDAVAQELNAKVRFEDDDESDVLTSDADWEADNLPHGAHIGRESMDNEPLKVGDRVQVYESARYGDPIAVVRGAGPDYGDGKARVHVALEDGRDDAYTPSTGRVRKLPAGENGSAVSVPEATVELDGYEWTIRKHVRHAA